MASNATEPTTSSDMSFPVREIHQKGFLALRERRDVLPGLIVPWTKAPTSEGGRGKSGYWLCRSFHTNRHEMYFPMMADRRFLVPAATRSRGGVWGWGKGGTPLSSCAIGRAWVALRGAGWTGAPLVFT